jgi:transcriptional regulator with XRE-family HTH domain
MSIVSNNIKYLRREVHNLTQEQFSRKIGIKRSLLGAYEEGRANPNYENLMNMANFFGIAIDTLMKTDVKRQQEVQLRIDKPGYVPEPQPVSQLLQEVLPEDDIFAPIPRKPTPQSTVTPLSQSLFPNPVVLEPISPFQPQTFQPTDLPPSQMLEPEKKTKTPRSVALAEWVSQAETAIYLSRSVYPDYLKQLPVLQLPMLPPGSYRAFEAGADFAQPGATLVGQAVQNWYDLRDGQHYLMVLHKKGLAYRRVYNQVKIKGTLLLTSDNPAFPIAEISIKEVLEAWEIKLCISSQLPENKTVVPSLEKLTQLVEAMQAELQGLKG